MRATWHQIYDSIPHIARPTFCSLACSSAICMDQTGRDWILRRMRSLGCTANGALQRNANEVCCNSAVLERCVVYVRRWSNIRANQTRATSPRKATRVGPQTSDGHEQQRRGTTVGVLFRDRSEQTLLQGKAKYDRDLLKVPYTVTWITPFQARV